MLYNFLLELLLQNPIGFGLSYFHCHLFLEIFFISLLISSVNCLLFRNMLFNLHAFLFLYSSQNSNHFYCFLSLRLYQVKVKLLSHVQLFATPWTVAYQAPPSMRFSRQECWSGLPFLHQGIFPTQESNPGLWHCRQTLYCLSHQGSLGM